MIKISVIMPVYNADNYLDMSLKSVLNQTMDDIEIICVNDGSTDNSLSILNRYSNQNDNIRVITLENAGSGSARNTGISEAEGEYLAFLDADDVFLDKKALEKMYRIAVKYDADFVGANLKRVTVDGTVEEEYNPENAPFTYFKKEEILTPSDYGIPWAFYKNIYRKNFICENDIKFPDLKRGQDPIFLANVLANLEEFPVLPVNLYGYNHSASGGVNLKLTTYDKKRDYIQHFVDTFDILEKNELYEALSVYKEEFINFLNFKQNIYDEDIRKIITELLRVDKYFKNTDYGYLIIDLIKNPPTEENEDYNLIKQCLFEESMLEDTFIDVDRLKVFAKISQKSSEDENLLKISFIQLKNIEEYTFEVKRKIFGQVGKYRKEIKHYINSNNSILTSNSWKFTSYLRSLKNKI